MTSQRVCAKSLEFVVGRSILIGSAVVMLLTGDNNHLYLAKFQIWQGLVRVKE